MDNRPELAQHKTSNNEGKFLFPLVDVIEDENGITLTADLPGVTKENLAIRVDADTLTIEGALTLGEAESVAPVYAEVRAAQYRRSFTLSRELDAAQIAASINDGVLTLHMPKREQAKPRKIEVTLS